METLFEKLEQLEKSLIEQAIGDNKTSRAIANELGISLPSLLIRMKKYSLILPKKPKRIKKHIKSKRIQSNGYIYIIKSCGLYKIGRTKSPKIRMHRYITENPMPIEVVLLKKLEDCVTNEIELLRMFADKKVRGDWFDLSEQDIETIKEMT